MSPVTPPKTPTKRKCLSLQEKVKLIEESLKPGMTLQKLADSSGVPRSTLSRILREKDTILNHTDSKGRVAKKCSLPTLVLKGSLNLEPIFSQKTTAMTKSWKPSRCLKVIALRIWNSQTLNKEKSLNFYSHKISHRNSIVDCDNNKYRYFIIYIFSWKGRPDLKSGPDLKSQTLNYQLRSKDQVLLYLENEQ